MKQVIAVKPQIKMFGIPVWHHHHSSKISVHNYNAVAHILMLKSNAVEVAIHPADFEVKGWVVDYKIKQSNESWSRGHIWMSKDNLNTAFGLSDKCAVFGGQNILDVHGGDVAQQGRYIRYGKYLNIPGPGTGHDGDANVSICIDESIKDALKRLLE
jgi:hypothetical protein